MDEIQRVLGNWLREARGSGQLREGVDEASFVAARFVAWWRSHVEDSLGMAEGEAEDLYTELQRLGGFRNRELHAAIEHATHIAEALSHLRDELGLGKGAR